MKIESLHRVARWLVALGGMVGFVAVTAYGQLGGMTEAQIQTLRQEVENKSSAPISTQPKQGVQTQKYLGPVSSSLPSRLEIFYSSRTGAPLLQYGYDAFGRGRDVVVQKFGGMQDDYVVGIGDGIRVNLRGQENKTFSLTVDDSGRLILPNLEPIFVAGKRFGDIQMELTRLVARTYIETKVFVSIDKVRQVSVLLTGEINSPGPLTLSGLSTSVDALILAGGVRKTGSLRNIRIIRGDRVIPIDLYNILLGEPSLDDFSLMEGDRIHVAPLGPVIAVSGWVKRPGIYELQSEQPTISSNELIAMAGGYEIPGSNNVTVLSVSKNGQVDVRTLSHGNGSIGEGDVLLVEPSDERIRNSVTLEGHVRQQGTYSLVETSSLNKLLGNGDVLGPRTYMPFAVITRLDTTSQLKSYLPFSVAEVVHGTANIALTDQDVVHIFSTSQIAAIANYLELKAGAHLESEQVVDDIISPRGDMGVRQLERIITMQARQQRMAEADRIGNAQAQGLLLRAEAPETNSKDLLKIGLDGMRGSTGIDLNDDILISLFEESRISLFGAVKSAGDYFVTPGISLGQALDLAGGTSFRADLSSAEITSTELHHQTGLSQTNRRTVSLNSDALQETKLKPLDVVRVREVYSDRLLGTIAVTGQVKYPGRFDLVRGERLSSVLQRAGGMTSIAYPYGAVFTRASVLKSEKDARDQLIDRMEGQLATIVATKAVTGDGAQFLSSLILRLKDSPVLGRVSIEVDPAVLSANLMLDTILEPGDKLYVPARPSSVTVVGEVLSPSSYQFDANSDANDYIALAGGFGRFADKRNAFVIMPDGRARHLGSGRWKFSEKMIAPGTIVVVPRNLRPFQWPEFLKDMTQLSSQLALTAASISVVTRDN